MRALVFALALQPFPALAFEDAATGFAFRAPPGAVEAPSTRTRFDAAVAIDAAPGGPPPAGTSGHLCEAGYKSAAANARLTQSRINALAASRARRERVKTSLGAAFDVTAIRVAGFGEVVGMEIEARPKAGPGRQDARAYLTIHETPKGRVTLVCVTKASAWEKALPLFRDIRSGLTLPQ